MAGHLQLRVGNGKGRRQRNVRAFGGDLGCVGGPAVVGFLSDRFGGDLETGILFALVFPVILTVVMLLKPKKHKSKLLFNKEENK